MDLKRSESCLLALYGLFTMESGIYKQDVEVHLICNMSPLIVVELEVLMRP